MIVKNGEILAIDHIAHDNTLSGNGTSAKPVGLSQSAKDLIDSKVKKTDFETYKSSAANQISNINTKITTDESSLESYKETVAASFTTVNDRITDVANAKQDKGNYVSATNFDNFKNTVEGQIEALETGKQPVGDYVVTNDFNSYKETVDDKFTTVNERITNVANAKQDKGDYVSASDFNTYKTNVAGEIARVDGRIDATNTNLENNYYDITETYNKTEVDEKFADFGGYKFRDADPEHNNQPILNDGEKADPKAIYLTQPKDEEQYLQWVCDEEHIDPPLWKCIGDTTMDLKDYAKTVDVVASANANKQEIETWANNKFETSADFNAVIANYYTKGDVDTKLATKVDNTYKTEVEQDFVDTSAWANVTFATKTDLNNDKSELEGEINNLESKIEQDINNASADIINKIDITSAYLDDKIDAVIDTLEDDYYTSEQIDARLAASGSYYTQNQVDEKLEEYAKSTELNPIKDDINSISADVDTLSSKVNGLHNTVIESSDTVIATPTTKPDGTISYSLSAIGGSSQSNYLWKPTVNAAGDISWELALTGDTPDPANIKGPQGIQGISGTPGKNGENGITPKLKIDENDIWNVSYDNEETWTSLGVSATGPQGPKGDKGDTGEQGPQGEAGAKGADGKDGVSPTVTVTNIPANPSDPDHQNGGTEITITDATSTNKFSAWNGNDGTMAGAPDIEGKNGISAVLAGSTYEVGLSSAFYNAITSVSSTYATKDALNDYLTKNDAAESYQPKGNYLSANALNGYATEQYVQGASAEVTAWVNDHHYLVADDIAGKADKADLQYVSAGVDYVSEHIPTKVTDLTDSANYYTINQTSAANELTTEFAKYALLANVPTKVTDLTDSADYAKKTDLEGFVTSSDVATQDTNYVMTTTGWKVLTLPGGGMTQVIHDATLTGQGNADDSKLGVAWSALSGNTIASALSAGSATVAANLGTSSFADITGAINAKADATAISDMLTKTEAESTYQTIAGMSNYLTTAQYNTDSATYVTSGNEISAANEQYALTTTGWTKIAMPATFTGVTTTGSISGGGVNNDTIGLLTSAENALKDVANKVAKPDTTQTELNNNYLIYSTLTDPAATTGWMPLSANYYSKSEADGRYQKKEDMSSYLTTAQYQTDSAKYVLTGDILTAANNALTGIKIGSTDYIIPNDYAKQTGNYQNLSAGSATSAYSAYSASYATTAASAYIDSNTTSAMSEIVNELHGKLDSTAAEATYLPLTGGTVTGQLTVSGSGFNNNLHLKRDNNDGFIGLANNGAITIKNVISNSTSQIEFLTSANKTFDITVKDNSTTPQPVGKLYVMSAHSPADAAATSANWANDGMLHIILES